MIEHSALKYGIECAYPGDEHKESHWMKWGRDEPFTENGYRQIMKVYRTAILHPDAIYMNIRVVVKVIVTGREIVELRKGNSHLEPHHKKFVWPVSYD